MLHILEPGTFDSAWLSKITDVGDNKRLKLNNLRKVLTGTLDYLKDVVGMQLSQFPLPDTNKVVDGDKSHLGRMLQLILGVAINCVNRENHIESIWKGMEQESQMKVVEAIQELEAIKSQSLMTPLDDGQVKKLMEEMEVTTAEKEKFAQKCHELEMELNLLKEEKSNLSAEFEHLQAQLGGGRNAGLPADSGIRYKELKNQNDTLKQELENIEAQKDEVQTKLEEAEARLEETEEKNQELQKLADQARSLKDEVDILRENSDKVGKYEGIIDTYKKKLEEMADMKRQIKFLEDKNAEYIDNNMELEEKLRKGDGKKPTTEIYRKQISDLNTKLTSETDRADKCKFENDRLMEKLEALTVEKDRIVAERDQLKESNEEMKYTPVSNVSPEYSQLGEEPDSGLLENIPPSVKARLVRLEKENQHLKKYKSSTPASDGDDTSELQAMIQDLMKSKDEMSNRNRELNMKVMELEANNKDLQTSSVPRVPGSREELELKLADSNKKITQLNETLQKKDAEINKMEERYKKYIDKAKSVIKTLDPKHNPSGAPEVTALRAQIEQKDKVIDELERETEKAKVCCVYMFIDFNCQNFRQSEKWRRN